MTPKNLYDYLYNGQLPEPGVYIQVIENNISIFENISFESLNEEDYYYTLMLLSQYASLVSNTENHTKALPLLTNAITAWDKSPYLDTPKTDIKWYSILKFQYGIACYYTNKRDESLQIFTWLTNSYPDNEKYGKWLISLRKEKLNRIQKIANIVIIITVLAALIALPKDENTEYLTTSIVVVCLILILALEVLKRYITKHSR